MTDQVKIHEYDKNITVDEYIDLTEERRYAYCGQLLLETMATLPVEQKKKKTIIRVQPNTFRKKLETAYMEGEIKMLEAFINIMIEHGKDLETFLGYIEMAVVKKLKVNNEKYATRAKHSTDMNVILENVMQTIETIRGNYTEEDGYEFKNVMQ